MKKKKKVKKEEEEEEGEEKHDVAPTKEPYQRNSLFRELREKDLIMKKWKKKKNPPFFDYSFYSHCCDWDWDCGV